MQCLFYKNLKLNINKLKPKESCRCFFQLFPIIVLSLYGANVKANQLSLFPIEPPSSNQIIETQAGQLPQSRIAYGSKNIAKAWFAGATNRYPHNVLGDALEASILIVETNQGKRLTTELPSTRVFEDLEPRLVDVNGDGSDEIIVVESDLNLGASLAIYRIINSDLIKIASTSFIGTPNRWLNPLGIGDFDGDGETDIAAVIMPHIGGYLRLYQLSGEQLSAFAEYSGASTHRIGSTELALGRSISSMPRDLLLVPNRSHQALMLLEWTKNGWQEHDRVELAGRLVSSLVAVTSNRWRFQLDSGAYYEVQFKK